MNHKVESLDIESKLIVFNWFYKLGKPLVSDVKYNQLFNEFKHLNKDSEVVTRTWSELDRPTELLIKCDMDDYSKQIEKELKTNSDRLFFLPTDNMLFRTKNYKEILDYFDRFIPKSIETIDSVQDSREWYKSLIGSEEQLKFNFSLKADGFNISLYYYKGYFVGARTRGRSGNSEDVTIAMSHVVPMKIKTEESFVRIKCEAVMRKDSLEVLRVMDSSREWKSARNSIRTLLMNDIGEKFNKFIIPLGFKVEGIRFNTREEEVRFIESCNIEAVYNSSITVNSHEELMENIKYFSEYDSKYHTDGCVVTVDEYSLFEEFDTTGKYDYAMKAYRFFNWESNLYCSVVLDTVMSYNSKNISLKLAVLPTKVSNGSHIANLDIDNISRMQKLGITKGSVVFFDMKSDSCVVLLSTETLMINNCIKNGFPVPDNLKIPYDMLHDRVMNLLNNGSD